MLFEWSMAEFVERYLRDERLQVAYLGQGVIGTNASPFDPGTASIRFHHASGRLGGMPGMWGYVRGGMGMVSFYFCDAAREAGATVVCGRARGPDCARRRSELDGGQRIAARTVVSNADPRVTLRLLGHVPMPPGAPRWKRAHRGLHRKAERASARTAQFHRAARHRQPHHYGQINMPLTKQEWKGDLLPRDAANCPSICGARSIFKVCTIGSVAPQGEHTMSVFAQYVPYRFAQGSWDERREEVRCAALGSLACFCSNIDRAVIDAQVMGPPDIEQKVGLTGGHIFQGECLPPYMWANRLLRAHPMAGVYLCGACTHPGGSVIGINGRNAAMAVLRDMADR